MIPRSASAHATAQSLEPGALVDLFVVHVDSLPGHAGEAPLRFSPGRNELGEPIVYGADVYAPIAIAFEDVEINTQGASPRPRLRISNITEDGEAGVFGSLTRDYDDFVGARVERIQIAARYLDAVNFAAGNALADPSAWQAHDGYLVECKSSETPVEIAFDLASPFDVEGVLLPRQQAVGAICARWKTYRGEGCGYTGELMFDAQDIPVTDPAQDVCSRTIRGCTLRHTRPISWFVKTPPGYAAYATAVAAESVLADPMLLPNPVSLGFPLVWVPERLIERSTRGLIDSALPVIDLSLNIPGKEVREEQINIVVLQSEWLPRASIPAAGRLCMWLQLLAGTLPDGCTIALRWAMRNADNERADHLIAQFARDDLHNFEMRVMSYTVPETAEFVRQEDWGPETYTLPITHLAPRIDLMVGEEHLHLTDTDDGGNTVVLQEGTEFNFKLRVGMPSLATRTDYSAFVGGEEIEKHGTTTDDLPFGGFPGAALDRRS